MSDRKIENIYALTRKSGFLPCHPERQRRIFSVSTAKGFFVTLFLRMTKGEAFYINTKQNFFPCHPERQECGIMFLDNTINDKKERKRCPKANGRGTRRSSNSTQCT